MLFFSVRPARQAAERLLPSAKRAVTSHCSQPASRLQFSTSHRVGNRNQVYTSVRNLDQFHTYQLLSSSARTPLLTLWTTSWCSTCRFVAPLMQELVESGVGEAEGGVGYCTVEYDAPDVMSAGLGLTYMINSVPTLLSFDAGEAQVQTKVTDGRQLADRKFLEEWIRSEARRHGNRGAGGPGIGSNLLGNLWGKSS
ncbi:Thioredoxin domain-containing protein [Madurella fahalii]|uniref:Thioredoxin domain-containing protein n=1 Tax=Madurella fahalii TaxID=1157608 RepID=A0ABQ0G2W8_9PEZI